MSLSRSPNSAALLLAAIVATSSSPAASQQADVAVTATISDPFLDPLEEATITIEYRNRGPDAAPRVASGFSYLATRGYTTVEYYPVAATAPCTMHYTDFFPPIGSGRPGFFAVTLFPPAPIPPGESRTCVIGVIATDEAPLRADLIRVPFRTDVYDGAVDPDLSNNRPIVEMVFARSPSPVPAMSSIAEILLAGVLMAAAAARMRGEPPMVIARSG